MLSSYFFNFNADLMLHVGPFGYSVPAWVARPAAWVALVLARFFARLGA